MLKYYFKELWKEKKKSYDFIYVYIYISVYVVDGFLNLQGREV